MMTELLIAKLPVADWVNAFVDWLTKFSGIFDGINIFISSIAAAFQWFFDLFPAWLFIALLLAGTYWVNRKEKKYGLLALELIGLCFIWNMGYWRDMTQTLTLVLTSCLIVYVIGIPLGIWMAQNKVVETIVRPILDFMQTMPAFVYLIPAVAFFGIGTVPGVIASVIFAMPPTVRMTNLGICQVPADLVEAANSYGATKKQKLFKLQLPLAKPTIMSGVTQSLMLALSMVVIASMIGAMGLGNQVYFAVGRNDAGAGFTAGLSIVIIAIIMERLSQALQRK